MTTGNFGTTAHGYTVRQVTRQQDTIWNSRNSAPGWGFPSSCTDLARMPRNLNDPNSYYISLGLVPWASQRDIKRACRTLLKRYHPDGAYPNRTVFDRIEEIYRILTDLKTQALYHSVPPGSVYIDSFVEARIKREAEKRGQTMGDLIESGVVSGEGNRKPGSRANDDPDEDEDEWIDAEPLDELDAKPRTNWDYLAQLPLDGEEAQQANDWYPLLLAEARRVDYFGPLKILLTQNQRGFARKASMVRIPRSMEVNEENAELLVRSAAESHTDVVRSIGRHYGGTA